MALKSYKPTTPGQRGLVLIDRSELWKGRPVKSLTQGLTKSGGRNNTGRITMRRTGGGAKRLYRIVDFKRNKLDMSAVVARIEYDPNRTAFIALIQYEDGEQAYILAPQRLAIGDTPMVRMDLSLDIDDVEIHAKYEHLNPGGSIKDRPVLKMLVEAILSGELTRDKIILDATSGNAGIAYAMIGATLGYKVQLVMPANASEERKKRVLAHGATIVFTDPMLGYDETLREVKRRYERDRSKYFYCDQYGNQNNPRAHYETTAEEILQQVSGITHFVAGVGTGGTISGVGRRLKERNPQMMMNASVFTNGKIVASGGCMPVFVENEMVGAFGVSGGTSGQDQTMADYARQKVGWAITPKDDDTPDDVKEHINEIYRNVGLGERNL